jgi:hypothetical protein
LGVKPTIDETAYTTGTEIANEKSAFFAIFGFPPLSAKFPLQRWKPQPVRE